MHSEWDPGHIGERCQALSPCHMHLNADFVTFAPGAIPYVCGEMFISTPRFNHGHTHAFISVYLFLNFYATFRSQNDSAKSAYSIKKNYIIKPR